MVIVVEAAIECKPSLIIIHNKTQTQRRHKLPEKTISLISLTFETLEISGKIEPLHSQNQVIFE